MEKAHILDYPLQHNLTQGLRKEAEMQNDPNFMAMWAGQSAYLSKGKPVCQLARVDYRDNRIIRR